eukprot:TRINITY_DN1300_c0_g4_i1.p1 TRINITY_DN1300_c0_g4~~TRINITY_DN1300_c0_g4_i1.p1  ORF type:complete len:211 (+),score=18.08 TRINITY_DN1300_c0_g4_i1:77-634(+)
MLRGIAVLACVSHAAAFACCAGSFQAEAHGAPYPPRSDGKAFDFNVYSTGMNFTTRATGNAVAGSLYINGQGHWSWTNEHTCQKYPNNQKHPNYCFGPGSSFPARLSDVTISTGSKIARWSSSTTSKHIVYTTPPQGEICHPFLEQGFQISSSLGSEDDSLFYYNVGPLSNPPSDVWVIPSFCPQ